MLRYLPILRFNKMNKSLRFYSNSPSGRIRKVLIANRGEIACRLITTAKRLGISSVAVFSDSDTSSLHTKLADEAYYIGGPEASKSYLDMNKIITAALSSGCDALHPGYGFLSQHPELASLCSENNITWIGPSASAIKSMGIKSFAKNIMINADVPIIPGYHGSNQDDEFLCSQAEKIGYPVMVKPVRGGGGKGMRVIYNSKEFMQAIASIKRESLKAFGDDELLIEKYIIDPRHIEVQVLCDNYNNAVYLYERDCSIQRRHQKIIEEAPAPNLTEEIRKKLGEAAVNAAKAVHYSNAGTVEFVMDRNGQFYFMEMNTRLQVEHPVTEMITNTDLVELQYKIASGDPLPFTQDEIKLNGHSFEARIYAEDPNNKFLPCTGTIDYLKFPVCDNKTIRIDTGIQQNDSISSYFDPMIAKLITWGPTRDEALIKLNGALSECHIVGLPNNISFLNRVISQKDFINADFTTSYIEQNPHLIENFSITPRLDTISMGILGFYKHSLVENRFSNFRMNHSKTENVLVKYGSDKVILVKITWKSVDTAIFEIHGELPLEVKYKFTDNQITIIDNQNRLYKCNFYSSDKHNDGSVSIFLNKSHLVSNSNIVDDKSFNIDYHYQFFVTPERFFDPSLQNQKSSSYIITKDGHILDEMKSPMDGTIVKIDCQTGQKVSAGDTLITVEAMKMEHAVVAPFDGIITEIFCNEKMTANKGQALLKLESIEVASSNN